MTTGTTIQDLYGDSGSTIALGSKALTVEGNGDYAGAIDGTGSLTKGGTGYLMLWGTNTYTGLTHVAAGTLVLYGGSAIADTGAVSVEAGATLYIGSNETIGSLAGVAGATVTVDNATLTTGDAATTTFAGMFEGWNAALIKQGSGTFTLSGANTYDGSTSVNAGTLVAGHATALGDTASGTIIASGATLEIANGVAIGAEAVTVSGAGVGGNGALIVASGSGSIGGAITLGASASIGGNGSLTLGDNVDDVAAGTSTLTQSGSGTLTFSGTVGASAALAAVTTTSGQTTALNGGSVQTTGAQTYGGIVTTSGATTLTSTGGGTIAANNAGNNVSGNVVFNTSGDARIVNSSALALGASSVGTLVAQSLAGNITLDGVITASGSGDAIVLASAAAFINNAGAGALSVTGGGRWLVYSQNAGANTFGGLDSANTAIFSSIVTSLPPGSVALSGNRYVFAATQTLVFTSLDASKTFGTDVTGSLGNRFTVGGFAAGVAGAFLDDTAATAFSGAAALTSTGAASGAAGGSYAIDIAQGSLASASRYAFSFVNTGRLTVTPGPTPAVTPQNPDPGQFASAVVNGAGNSSSSDANFGSGTGGGTTGVGTGTFGMGNSGTGTFGTPNAQTGVSGPELFYADRQFGP